MPGQTERQKRIVGRVMHAFKDGSLRVKAGRKVKEQRQAIAIALREAGASKAETPESRADRRGAKARAPATPRETRAALYAEARERNVRGRSSMTKAELQAALR